MHKSITRLHNKLDRLTQNILDYFALKSSGKLFSNLTSLVNPFFIVLTPGSLHLAEKCLSFIPSHIEIILLLNGLDRWEESWVRSHLNVTDIIALRTANKKFIEHGKIFDLIIDNYQKPFGILDFDCFVLNPSIFDLVTSLDSNSMLNALFLRATGIIEVPGTFFMFINSPLILRIKNKYHVNSRIVKYEELNTFVKRQISTIGFKDGLYPQDGMKQFDTLMLIVALGITEGLFCNYTLKIPGSPSLTSDLYDVFHISGTTVRSINHLQNPSHERWRLRGSYFWYRLLEDRTDDELKDFYQNKYGDIKSEQILSQIPGSREKLGEGFFTAVENVINHY